MNQTIHLHRSFDKKYSAVIFFAKCSGYSKGNNIIIEKFPKMELILFTPVLNIRKKKISILSQLIFGKLSFLSNSLRREDMR
jgi:hypothetical protein